MIEKKSIDIHLNLDLMFSEMDTIVAEYDWLKDENHPFNLELITDLSVVEILAEKDRNKDRCRSIEDSAKWFLDDSKNYPIGSHNRNCAIKISEKLMLLVPRKK